MKRTEKFSFTLKIPHVCELEIVGLAYCRTENEWKDMFDWDIEEVLYPNIISTRGSNIKISSPVNIKDFAMHAYGDEIDEAIYPYVVGLFGYQEPYDDSPDREEQQEMPDIFGTLTDMNPRFNHSTPEHGC